MGIIEIEPSPKDHIRLFHIAKEILNVIKTGVFIPNQTFQCKDCEYFGIC